MKPLTDLEVRPFERDDLGGCTALSNKVYGFDLSYELRDAINTLSPIVVLREGRISAYALSFTVWPQSYAVANTLDDMKALLRGAAAMNSEPLSFLLPVRQADIFRWCIGEGFRAVRPMTLMSMGTYEEPDGYHFPSIMF